jgi:DNA polymerase (family 10)
VLWTSAPLQEENQPQLVTLGGTSLGRAHALATFAIDQARRLGIPVDHLLPVGGLRRSAPVVGDVALLAVAPVAAHAVILDAFSQLSHVASVGHGLPLDATAFPAPSRHGLVSSTTATTERGPITIHVADPETAGAALVWHTGSQTHTHLLQQRARALDARFEAGTLTRAGAAIACPSESEFYRSLQLAHIAPELREGADEIERAARGVLPPLIAVTHIRGDLHMHSTWSDGRDGIGQMAGAARDLDYDFIAITDHSERARSSRTLARADIARQRIEIDAARSRFRPLTILHGIEVDIMPDGSLDFPDEILAGFDLVLASLHDPAGQDGVTLTERYLSAMRNRFVNVVTHPANRAPGRFDGYDVDFERLFQAAVETGTALEVDGAPNHLDMDGTLARRAVDAGVTVVVNSDSHRAAGLGPQMAFGIGTARRGWVEPRHVLNARSAEDVRAFVAAKRRRG